MICTCPSCSSTDIFIFYRHENAPVHSVLVHRSQKEAVELPTGEIQLAFCRTCGFIYNATFDASLQDYFLEYESTQGFSPTFNAFAQNVAQHLVDRYDLHGKDIIEIGCGQGEFLSLLCELGDNRGIGFDPAFTPERSAVKASPQPQFIKDYYSEKYTQYRADFIVCKMTLEHISPVAELITTLRRSIGENTNTIIFFQIPEVTRILEENAFWDIYYEHCSYFSLGSLARLFRRCGFDVLDLWRCYGDQYLMIEARPTPATPTPPLPVEEVPGQLQKEVEAFQQRAPRVIRDWQDQIKELKNNGKRIVLWGGGSKAVAFVTTLGLQDEISYAVDINPYKNGSFMAGSGHPIVSPAFLQESPPDVVLLMNPIYEREVREQLSGMGLQPIILPVGT